jgi:hypothetical protein
MANTKVALVGGSQSKLVTLDTTTTDLYLGAAPGNAIGSAIIQVEGSGWTGSITPQARLVGAVGASMGWVSVAYHNLATAADVAAGTDITASGIYAVRLDQGMELCIDATVSAGSVKVLFHIGLG